MYTFEKTKVLTQTLWFYILCILSQNDTDSKSPPRLQIAFRFDSSSSFPVINKPTYIITQMINFCYLHQQDT